MSIQKISAILACLSAIAAGCDDTVNALIGGDIVCDPTTNAVLCDPATNQLRACLVTSWQTTVACPNGCDDSLTACAIPEGQECIVSTCEGDRLKPCVDGKWQPAQTCNNGVCRAGTCMPNSTTADCKTGEKKCSNDASAILTCNSRGTWDNPLSCGEDQKCDAESKECKPTDEAKECTGSQTQCDANGNLQTCNDGKWDTAPCPNRQTCQNGACSNANTCQNGEKKCSDDASQILTCNDNTWSVSQTCENGQKCDVDSASCKNESEAKICTPNQTKCNNDQIVTCNNDGKWNVPEDCPEAGYVCENNACVPSAPDNECGPEGIQRCTGSQIQTCDGMHWGTPTDCPAGQTCKTTDPINNLGQCQTSGTTVCSVGQIQCQNDRFLRCTDNQWGSTPESCPDGQTCKTVGGVDKCSDASVIADECTENDFKCLPSGSMIIPDMYQQCKDRKWQASSCSAETPACDASAKKCTSRTVEAPCFNNNQYQCSDDKSTIQKCVDNVWVDFAACGENLCTSTTQNRTTSIGCSDCTAKNTQICDADNDKIMTCTIETPSKNQSVRYWKTTQECGAGLCQTNGSQAACNCKTNEMRCSGDLSQSEICKNSTWQRQEDCAKNDMLCNADNNYACECVNGDFTCSGDLKKTRVCNAGKWIDTPCPNDEICDAALSACVKKTVNACTYLNPDKLGHLSKYADQINYACIGTTLVRCTENNVYQTVAQCASGCVETKLSDNTPGLKQLSTATCASTDDNGIGSSCSNGGFGGIIGDAMRCSPKTDQIQVCKNDKWQTQTLCNEDEICMENQVTFGMDEYACVKRSCQPLETSCNDKNEREIIMCVNNQLQSVATCQDGRICQNGKCILKTK